MKYSSTNRGYTLLFAVLTASLVLGVAVFILSVSRKQYILSVTARNSTYAIYAADSGLECMSLDPQKGEHVDHNISCNGVNTPLDYNDIVGYTDPTDGSTGHDGFEANINFVFREVLNPPSPIFGCAKVNIVKYEVTVGSGKWRTIVQSRGYNQCTDTGEPDTSSTRTVERALQLVSGS